ncbi:uncharacterized protein ColSpa_03856 [Colletotrichum spaethianum]|uniref:Uncharacterized protein n=1 Tax=Colletotrichum spaethianum TaxID=700344 RepID=A0AA37LCX9_9PEZI|nr:uncharacterized protein ColSpa_03856 [Colletotrichum spaethianum]GKT43675.1 hypothetical protein ColSpa_03856 [Colletotrichum spaethianum]
MPPPPDPHLHEPHEQKSRARVLICAWAFIRSLATPKRANIPPVLSQKYAVSYGSKAQHLERLRPSAGGLLLLDLVVKVDLSRLRRGGIGVSGRDRDDLGLVLTVPGGVLNLREADLGAKVGWRRGLLLGSLVVSHGLVELNVRVVANLAIIRRVGLGVVAAVALHAEGVVGSVRGLQRVPVPWLRGLESVCAAGEVRHANALILDAVLDVVAANVGAGAAFVGRQFIIATAGGAPDETLIFPRVGVILLVVFASLVELFKDLLEAGTTQGALGTTAVEEQHVVVSCRGCPLTIIVVPLAINKVASIGSVVTAAEATKVVVHRDEVTRLALLLQGGVSELLHVAKRLLATVVLRIARLLAENQVPGLLAPVDDDALAEANKRAAANVVQGRRLRLDVDNLEGLLLARAHVLVATLAALLAVRLVALVELAAGAANFVVASAPGRLGLVSSALTSCFACTYLDHSDGLILLRLVCHAGLLLNGLRRLLFADAVTLAVRTVGGVRAVRVLLGLRGTG